MKAIYQTRREDFMHSDSCPYLTILYSGKAPVKPPHLRQKPLFQHNISAGVLQYHGSSYPLHCYPPFTIVSFLLNNHFN